MGLSPQAVTLVATTLLAVGVAYYYLVRKSGSVAVPARATPPEPLPSTGGVQETTPAPNEPPARDVHVTTDPPAATCPPTTSATRPSSRWSVGGTAVGAYEEFAGGAVGGAVDGAVTGAAGAFPQGVGVSARVESS